VQSGLLGTMGGAGGLPGLFEHGHPESFLLALLMGAVHEQVFPRLDLVLTPPAGGVRSAGGPRQALAGQAVSCLQLAELLGEALVCAHHRGIRLLLLTELVLIVAGPGKLFLAQPLVSLHVLSEKSRLTLARDLGSGKSLSLTVPSGSVVENHQPRWRPVRPLRVWPIRRRPHCLGSLDGSDTT